MSANEERCRVVSLKWDRGWEQLEAIVRAHSASGVIVTELWSLEQLAGLRWVRDDEIVSIEDLNDDDPHVRLAELCGWPTEQLPVSMTELPVLLEHLRLSGCLFAVYRAKSGSRKFVVGEILGLDERVVRITDVDDTGKLTGDETEMKLTEIVGIDWGTHYLDALAMLVKSAETP